MENAKPAALEGRRVVELCDESGMYCGKLLADLGADVLRVEPPGGDPLRGIPPHPDAVAESPMGLRFRYLNTNKRTQCLDLADAEGAEAFKRLVAASDLVLETMAPGRLDALGLGYEALKTINPAIVLVSMSGFGQTGPHRDYIASDLVTNAVGGALYVTGDPEDPPVNLAGDQAHMMTSSCAAASSLIALRQRDETGQGQHVDISAQEVMLAVTHISGVGKYLDDDVIPVRNGTSLFAAVPSGAYACKDGLIYLIVNRPLHWEALAKWIHEQTGNEEVIDPMFQGPSSVRVEYRELLDIFIGELTCKYTVDEIYHEGQRRHIAMTPVSSSAQIVADPHLAARKFFVDVPQADGGKLVMPGAPYRFDATPWRIDKPAPLVEADNKKGFEPRGDRQPATAAIRVATPFEPQALADLRVVEFTAGMAGPWIGRFMAYCGADVVKVESVKRPGVVRLYIPPRNRELGIQPTLSPWFTDWDAGKRFVTLDLANPEATELAKKLVASADVVIENNSTGVMEKLGLGYDVLRSIKPDLIHLSSTGYGDSGPCAKYVTWGPNIEAISGLSQLSGYPHRECTNTQYAYPDALSALHGLVAVMAALDHRSRTGEGQHIGLSQLETTIASLGVAIIEPLNTGNSHERVGNRSTYMAPHGCFACAGKDRWCAISVKNDEQWLSLCGVLGRDDWAHDPRFETVEARLANIDNLDDAVSQWTRTRDAHEVMHTLQRAGVPAGVAQNVDDMLNRDPHLADRGYFETVAHLVKGSVVAPGIPVGLTLVPGRTTRAGAAMGEDNDAVFGDLLGISADELQRLRDMGAIET